MSISDYDLSEMDAAIPATPATIILVTGGPPSTTVARLEFSFVFEFVPFNNYYYYCNMLDSSVGASTL